MNVAGQTPAMTKNTYYVRWTLSNRNNQRTAGGSEHKVSMVEAESTDLAIDVAAKDWIAEGGTFLPDDTIQVFDNASCEGRPLCPPMLSPNWRPSI